MHDVLRKCDEGIAVRKLRRLLAQRGHRAGAAGACEAGGSHHGWFASKYLAAADRDVGYGLSTAFVNWCSRQAIGSSCMQDFSNLSSRMEKLLGCGHVP